MFFPFRPGVAWQTFSGYLFLHAELARGLRQRDWDEFVRPGSFYSFAVALLVGSAIWQGDLDATPPSLREPAIAIVFVGGLLPFFIVQHLVLSRGHAAGASIGDHVAGTTALLGAYSYLVGMLVLHVTATNILAGPPGTTTSAPAAVGVLWFGSFFYLLYCHVRVVRELHPVTGKRLASAVAAGISAGLLGWCLLGHVVGWVGNLASE
jgi:hypothetical protein